MSSFGISGSGIRAAFKMLDISANNTANINTDGYKKDKAVFKETLGGGVKAEAQKTTGPGPFYQSGSKLAEASNTDYAEESVNRILSKMMLSANIAVLRTTDEMEKTAVDIKA